MSRQKLFSVGSESLRWDYFRAGGKGGQKQNKTDSGARVTHIPTGIACEAREQRSQLQNRKRALEKLSEHPEFVLWCKMQVAANLEGYESIGKKVDEMMEERNLLVETEKVCRPGESFCDLP